MSMPFYVSPEQLMKDRADYARKGIARGRSVIVVAYDDGIAFATENPSRALHKVSEIYDRIAFAAVGKYNEFENLRVAGVRLADLRGYAYDRADVTGRDHQHHDVRHLRATGPHGGEGRVAGRVEEGEGRAGVGRDLVGGDVRRDAGGFGGDHVGVADRVQGRGLAVVHVAHDRDDRGPRAQGLGRVGDGVDRLLDVG